VFNLQQDIRVDGPSGANSFERGWDGGNSFGGASPEFGGSPMPDDQSWKGMDALDVPDEGSPGGFLPQESGPPPNKKVIMGMNLGSTPTQTKTPSTHEMLSPLQPFLHIVDLY